MKLARLSVLALAILTSVFVTTTTQAMYHSGTGGFLQRDPGNSALPGRPFIPRAGQGYQDGMNLNAGHFAMRGGLDPSGTVVVAVCEANEWLREQKGVDSFEARYLRNRGMWHYSGNATFGGDLDGEILATMIRSRRVFIITDGTIQNLELHVFARNQIAQAAKAFSTPFMLGNGLNPAFWQTGDNSLSTNDPSGAVDNIFDEPRLNGMACSPGEIFCQLKGVLEAYRNEQLGGPGEAQFDLQSDGLPLDRRHNSRNQNSFNRLEFLYNSTVRDPDDWIPGDAGYIDNTTVTDAMDAAITGENIIYVGDGQFFGHGQPRTRTLEDMTNVVDGWSEALNDTALDTRRTGPKIGLDAEP